MKDRNAQRYGRTTKPDIIQAVQYKPKVTGYQGLAAQEKRNSLDSKYLLLLLKSILALPELEMSDFLTLSFDYMES